MSKRNRKEKFIPFKHENLGFKNILLKYARDSKEKEEFVYQLASGFIYISFTEYLVHHFLKSLNYLLTDNSRRSFAGILYFDRKKEYRQKTLGEYIKILDDYEFPDKKEIMKLFKDINKLRNIIYHNSVLDSEKEFIKLVKDDIAEVQGKSEELLDRINNVSAGLEKILYNPSIQKNGSS